MSGFEEKMDLLPAEKRALLAQMLRTKTENTRKVPLSFAQQRLWFLDQLDPGSAFYNISRAIRLKGALNLHALRQALNVVVSRHESLRTNFTSIQGEPVQLIAARRDIELQSMDLRELSEGKRESETRRIASEASRRGFNLAKGDLLRAVLLRLDNEDHVLLLVLHHIVSDGWSMGVLFRELGDLYEAFSSSSSSPLPELPIQYGDFARWQREWLQGRILDDQVSFWKQQLAGAPVILELSTDKPRPVIQTFAGSYHTSLVSKELADSINDLSRREGVTLFMTLLAAFQTLLYRYTNQEDIVVGTPIANRTRTETEGLIGLFVNTLVMRTDLSGNPSFRELLKRVREISIDAFAHQDLPFERLVEELQPDRSLGRMPLFQALFALQNVPKPTWKMDSLDLTEFAFAKSTSKLDLSLYVGERPDGLSLSFEYSTDLFESATIERMAAHFQMLLEGIVLNPEQRIGGLPLLTKRERAQLLVEWNDTEAEYPKNKCIHELFEEQVARTPDDTAVIFETAQVTYGELNRRANKLAHFLKARGVGPEVLVGLCVERSLEMVVGLLGILKAGGAYIPLDLTHPAERISFMLADSGARLLVTQQRMHGSLANWGGKTIYLDSEWPQIAAAPADNPTNTACAENSAYVLYTSGSTGQPKGVVSAHRASVNRFAWMWRTYPFAAMEVCCQKTSLSFVDSIWEIFGPLLKGVPLVIIPDEVVKDTQLFITTLSTNRVTRLVLVPSLLRGMLGTGEDLSQQLRHLRYCVCSGETVAVELARSFREQIPCATLINLYGSSEVAADILCYEVHQPDKAGTIPIGKAISNTNVYILDSNFQPTPLGVPGEICVGGEGLARGYLNAVKLTAEKFVAHPFSRVNGGRMFRTGDIGRYLPNGNIEYHGRRDHQVKVRGYRIELGEIEAHLATHPQVHQAVAITRESEPGNQQIVAYVIALAEPPTDNELRAHLRTKLPDYMLPATFVLLDAFPLTSSGKVNRLALPPPTGAQLAAGKDFVAPRTDIEKELASIWEEVLRRERVGVNDNFFEIGGHSLLATQVISRVRKHFELELPLRSMFESPTVAGLASVVELRQKIKPAPVPAMRSRRSASKIEQLSTEEIDSLLSIALSKADLK